MRARCPACPVRRSQPVVSRPRAAGPRALARARCLRRVAAPSRGRRSLGLLRGPADGQRPARRPPRARARLQGHLPALPDDARRPTSSARAAGTATGCPSRSRSSGSSASAPRRRSRLTGSPSSTQNCRESVFAFLEDWNRLTERIGFWIDLDDAYRTLDATYIESVWWALRQIHDKGLLYEGHKVVPYCPRCGTSLSSATSSASRALPRRVDPSVYVRFPVTEDRGPLRGRRRAARLDHDAVDAASNAAVAVDPELRYVRVRAAGQEHARRAGRGARRAGARGGHDGRDPRALPGRQSSTGLAIRRRSTSCPASCGASWPQRAARRLRHRRRGHRPRPHRHRVRRGRLPPRRALRAGGRQPGPRRRHVRRAHRPVRRPLRQGRRRRPRRGPAQPRPAAARGGPTSTPTRTAGAATRRSSTTPSRLGTSRRRRSATSCWPPTTRSTGTPSTSRRVASATGCATTSTGRCRASATGARRCRCGAAARATST